VTQDAILRIWDQISRATFLGLVRYLQVAIGSAGELEYDLLLAGDLAFLEKAEGTRLEQEVIEVKRMLTGLIRRIRTGSPAFGAATP